MRAVWFILLALIWPIALAAQSEPAVLVADQVLITEDSTLIADGSVEVFQGDVSLTASRISYTPGTEKLTIEGPITLRDGETTVIVADEAELDRDLRNGILRSARLVLDRHLQIGANQIDRVDGRYHQLYKTVATSCRVCSPGQTPLWHIRARRVVHDTEKRQLYFDDAHFRVGPFPIFYLPRLRLPDPTLDRATGFLIPRIASNTSLGTGVKVPYFIKLGDHRDLTLTPYVSPKTRTLEFRYRQAFRRGRITFNGAYTDDDVRVDEPRYYVFGSGTFGLGRDYSLSFDVETVSDDAYLPLYAYSFKTRLDSAINLSRARRDQFIQVGGIVYDSLRANEIQSQLPTIVLDGKYVQRFFPDRLGGEFRLSVDAHDHERSSQSLVSGEGRDVSRLVVDTHWLDSWTLTGGLRADAKVGASFEAFEIRQDEVYGGQEVRALPQARLALSLPLRKTGAAGGVHILMPKMQLGWTGGSEDFVPLEESTRVEFDEGNLFALSRFPEADRREHGLTFAYGLNWVRVDARGWESNFSVGQIVRETEISDFTKTSGLDGTRSDILVAGQLKSQTGLSIASRALFDGELAFTKAELRADWSNARAGLGTSYVWLEEDAGEERTRAVSELTVNGRYRVGNHWSLAGNWRYDLEDDRTSVAGVNVGYDNECVSVGLSVQRRFSSSANIEPATNFGFTIALRGFSAMNGTESYTRTCSPNAS